MPSLSLNNDWNRLPASVGLEHCLSVPSTLSHFTQDIHPLRPSIQHSASSSYSMFPLSLLTTISEWQQLSSSPIPKNPTHTPSFSILPYPLSLSTQFDIAIILAQLPPFCSFPTSAPSTSQQKPWVNANYPVDMQQTSLSPEDFLFLPWYLNRRRKMAFRMLLEGAEERLVVWWWRCVMRREVNIFSGWKMVIAGKRGR